MSIHVVYNNKATVDHAGYKSSPRSLAKTWQKHIEASGLQVILRPFDPERDPQIMALLEVEWVREDGEPCFIVAYDDQRKRKYLTTETFEDFKDVKGYFVSPLARKVQRQLMMVQTL